MGGITITGARDLLFALHSRVTPDGLKGPSRMPRIEPWSPICKANALSVVLMLWPQEVSLSDTIFCCFDLEAALGKTGVLRLRSWGHIKALLLVPCSNSATQAQSVILMKSGWGRAFLSRPTNHAISWRSGANSCSSQVLDLQQGCSLHVSLLFLLGCLWGNSISLGLTQTSQTRILAEAKSCSAPVSHWLIEA